MEHMRGSSIVYSNGFDPKDAYIRHLTPYQSSKKGQQTNLAPQRTLKQPNAITPPVIWGRNIHSNWIASLFSLGMVTFAPCMVIFFWVTLQWFEGSILQTSLSFLSSDEDSWIANYGPQFQLSDLVAYIAWLIFQAVLYFCLPGPLGTGQLTPAGHQLEYCTNGLSAWLITNALFVSLCILGIVDPAIIAKHWSGLLLSANLVGFLLSCFAYFKAHFYPTHISDLKLSGSRAYDFYMGIEFNPRFGKAWDFKLFTNGRPGIVAWTLIDLSFVAWQYETHGHVNNSIVIATILHSIYVIDFFVNEDWYLRTIDIAHEHYGFYLAWGSLVWLPSMYTLQTQYLARYPVDLPLSSAIAILSVGVAGYVLFRSVNWQKDAVRRSNGECLIWGKKAEVLVFDYETQDGKQHKSLLLCSGWWGLSRHANYLGDLVLSYSMCATCGMKHILPWFYAIFMTILLLHRCHRDEQRCAAKYGKQWETYIARVPWKLIPGIY